MTNKEPNIKLSFDGCYNFNRLKKEGLLESISMNENDLISEIVDIVDKLDGKIERLTTYDNSGRQSKKIVIEYGITHQERKINDN
tara:strand:- start:1640 stop:1894 length:255 start_codon:yes stop_codon:yes gene_type:complete